MIIFNKRCINDKPLFLTLMHLLNRENISDKSYGFRVILFQYTIKLNLFIT